MAMTTEIYSEQTSLPFTSAELGAFHRFHAYDWDNDDTFQTGLRTITQSQPNPSQSEVLKMKQYYFSTRMNTRINLDDYISWRKHLEKPTDDPNVPIFKRFDAYNFDNDVKFQQGLPSFIGQLIKEGKNTLDKAALQKELTKAKAFYYARFIELFDFPAYLAWQDMEKSQTGPACPYAHLWQNKGKGSGNEMEEDSQKFLTATAPVSAGALQIHIHSPATKNSLTGTRLAKISESIAAAEQKDSITSIFWTVNSGKSTTTERDPESEIVTKDEKWFSGGVIVKGSSETEHESHSTFSSTKGVLGQYYTLVEQVADFTKKQQKPVVTVVDGFVSLSAAYLAFGSGAQRVITENAALSFTPLETIEASANQVVNPFAGLYLLSRIQRHAKTDQAARPLANGAGHYLAFCPDYILRGPDLKKLGLADFFVSSGKKKDIEEAILSVAGCPPPHTTQAIRMALNAEVVYPGPAKIDVWRKEIQACFGESTTVEEMVANLGKFDNKWSKSIRAYIESMDPLLVKLIYKAVVDASAMETFEECAKLEYRLWQRYNDFSAKPVDAERRTEALRDLESFFEPLETEEKDLLGFPFADWIKEHGHDDDSALLENVVEVPEGAKEADGVQACPFLAGKMPKEESAVPADHPNIPGVDFGAANAEDQCPFLSAKKQGVAATVTVAPTETVPSDHPSIPGVDLNDPQAIQACPFLSAKKAKEVEVKKDTPRTSQPAPEDHPMIPGVDLNDPEAIKACPFLSAKNAV